MLNREDVLTRIILLDKSFTSSFDIAASSACINRSSHVTENDSILLHLEGYACFNKLKLREPLFYVIIQVCFMKSNYAVRIFLCDKVEPMQAC